MIWVIAAFLFGVTVGWFVASMCWISSQNPDADNPRGGAGKWPGGGSGVSK